MPKVSRAVTPDCPDDDPYPLHIRLCGSCHLVQVDEVPPLPTSSPEPPVELSWRSASGPAHARRCAETMRRRLRLDAHSLVIDLGSTRSPLLRHFQAAGIKVLGIGSGTGADITGVAPANTAGARLAKRRPFTAETAMDIAVRHGCADVIVVDDVMPYVPDLFDFAAGLACILRPNGILTLQVPHLLSLLEDAQFDAFRHDCLTYLSLDVLERLLRSVGLRVFDAERLPEDGGLLRVQACHVVGPHPARPGLKSVRLAEGLYRPDRVDLQGDLAERVAVTRDEISGFLRNRHAAGRRVVAYGAVSRGAMLLNNCGITPREISFVADPDPARHGRLLPGSRIPIRAPEALMEDPPDDVLILPWPDAAAIASKLAPLHQQGTQLWAAMPRIARV